MAERRDSAVQTGSHGDVSLVRHGQLSQLHAVPVVCKRLTTAARLAHTRGTHARGTHTCALSTVTENQNRGVP